MRMLVFVFLFLTISSALIAARDILSNIPNTSLIEWVINRQQWRATTRLLVKLYPNDSDSQILERYLKLFVEHCAQQLPEQAVEYCPCGVAELEYILTGHYPDGPCILIALTESVWLEHLHEIEERIALKLRCAQ